MSTPTPVPALFARLFDDAAVFPPGSYPPDVAIARHVGRRGGAAESYVGALLLPPDLVGTAPGSADPLTIEVVGRPGVAVASSASTMPETNHAAKAGGRVWSLTPAGSRPRSCHGTTG